MHWKIYYGDGSVYDSEEGSSPPARDVQVIVQDHPKVGKELVTGADYFIRKNGRWMGVDLFGLWDYLLDLGLVLFGRMVTTEEYREVMRRAMADRDKAGWLPFERKPE